jgi:hypothetical protein
VTLRDLLGDAKSSLGDAERSLGDVYSVDVADPRFAKLFSSHQFALDPTHPRYELALQILQDPILLMPLGCFRVAAAQTLVMKRGARVCLCVCGVGTSPPREPWRSWRSATSGA